MMRYLLILLLFPYTIFAQPEPKKGDPLKYDYTTARLIFDEPFDNNNNGWQKKYDGDTTHSGDSVNIGLKNGMLTIDNPKQSGWMYGAGPDKELDFNRDWEIEFFFKIPEKYNIKKAKAITGFYWGMAGPQADSGCTWISVAQKNATVTYCSGGDHKSCGHKNFPIIPALRKENFYKLSIRKLGNDYYFFINDKFAKRLPAETLPGKKLYISANYQASVEYDYVRVYYLD